MLSLVLRKCWRESDGLCRAVTPLEAADLAAPLARANCDQADASIQLHGRAIYSTHFFVTQYRVRTEATSGGWKSCRVEGLDETLPRSPTN